MYGTAGGGGGYRDDVYASSQAEPLTGGAARRRQVRVPWFFSLSFACVVLLVGQSALAVSSRRRSLAVGIPVALIPRSS